MSHSYLFDTYQYLQQRVNEIKPRLTSEDADQHAKQYAAGQIEAICDLERFLKEHYDRKLPRRMRQLHKPSSICESKIPS
jgi:hypothetical protein